jgi:hypothetical protein
LWTEQIRGVGTGLGRLVKSDPGLSASHQKWLVYSSDKWNVTSIVGDGADAAQAASRVRIAATKLNMAAKNLKVDLQKRHYTA